VSAGSKISAAVPAAHRLSACLGFGSHFVCRRIYQDLLERERFPAVACVPSSRQVQVYSDARRAGTHSPFPL